MAEGHSDDNHVEVTARRRADGYSASALDRNSVNQPVENAQQAAAKELQ